MNAPGCGGFIPTFVIVLLISDNPPGPHYRNGKYVSSHYRIFGAHRLVYRVSGERREQRLEIAQCRYHY
jgi:hypothetical protein